MTEKPATPAEIAREFCEKYRTNGGHFDGCSKRSLDECLQRSCMYPATLESMEVRLTRWLDSHLAEERAKRQRAEAALWSLAATVGGGDRCQDCGMPLAETLPEACRQDPVCLHGEGRHMDYCWRMFYGECQNKPIGRTRPVEGER